MLVGKLLGGIVLRAETTTVGGWEQELVVGEEEVVGG